MSKSNERVNIIFKIILHNARAFSNKFNFSSSRRITQVTALVAGRRISRIPFLIQKLYA